MTSHKTLKERLLNDPKVKAEYDRLGPVYEIVSLMVEARHDAGLTQKDVAERMGTKQSVIARLENAHHLPTLEFVARYASAIGRKVDIRFIRAA